MAFVAVAVIAIFLCFYVVIQRRFLDLPPEAQRDAMGITETGEVDSD
jgi:hypothetical protein